jgi:hypothetical protein
MRFFFPDSQDFVDGTFDFRSETRSATRVRQRDDLYPHELFSEPPYDGLLVSKAVVDGIGGGTGKYSVAQRHRFLRVGVREYFRINGTPLETMGDCGAFTYVREERPPYKAEEVADFYEDCGFDYGISVDHVILGFDAKADNSLVGLEPIPVDWKKRQELTFELAESFLNYVKRRSKRFIPIGVAQGWSPRSYAHAVEVLQTLGYQYIAFGGFVPLKTPDILACLRAAAEIKHTSTVFHLLGITRCEHVQAFAKFGAISFDSTSPLRKAFKDDKNNYYAPDRTYTAVRVPQVDANPDLVKRITAGQILQEEARGLEQQCLQMLESYDSGKTSLDETVKALSEYERLFDGKTDRSNIYREVLAGQPWKRCPCAVCRALGIHVIMFRGAERNRRRGFHNLYVFNRQLHHHLSNDEKLFTREEPSIV